MLTLDLDRLACDACCLRCVGAGTEDFVCMLLHACFVLGRRILDHLRVGRDNMKRRQDRQHGDFGADPLGQGDGVLESFPGEFRPVRWYQDVGIHRALLDHDLSGGISPDESQIGMNIRVFQPPCKTGAHSLQHQRLTN